MSLPQRLSARGQARSGKGDQHSQKEGKKKVRKKEGNVEGRIVACTGPVCLHAPLRLENKLQEGRNLWFTAVFQMPKIVPGNSRCSINIR